MIKTKDDIENEAFQGCDTRLKYDLYEVVNKYDGMFKEPKGLPPKRGIQHEIQLQQDCPSMLTVTHSANLPHSSAKW